MKIDFKDHIPIFIQIKRYVQLMVINEKLRPGEKMPSVRTLSQELEVNPNTVARAYQDLERDGFSYTLRGMGSFITKDTKIIDIIIKEMSAEYCNEFIEGMSELGFSKEMTLVILKEHLKRGE